MSRIQPVNSETASNDQQALFEDIFEEIGMVPALMRVMAHSPAVLDGYLAIQKRLDNGLLPKRLRYQIALAVSQAAGSDYCVAAYTALGRTVGLSEEALRDARVASSPDRRTDTALKFARVLGIGSGPAASSHLSRLRNAGFDDSDIVEIVAHAMTISLANILYHLSDVAVDFPSVDSKNE